MLGILVSSWPLNDQLSTLITRAGIFPLALALPIAYGGVHLSAWNYEFPSTPERTLWIVAAITIAGMLPTVTVIWLFWASLINYGTEEGYVIGERYWSIEGILYAALGFYAVARVYIVVESFASLRHVPIGVYWTPAWLQMIPHF
jgi:hypothetical protein